jgi:1-acyl-sn-glycerol-3-phosphate acyltransferase
MKPSKIIVYILEPIYPKSFLNSDKPSKEEISEAVDKMTLELEQKIKDKARSLYE